MPNQLTGDFDAVAEVRVEAINRILAALHQNGLDQNTSPSLPHRLIVSVGEKLKYITELAKWVVTDGTGWGVVKHVPESAAKEKGPQGPPGAAKSTESAKQSLFAKLAEAMPTSVQGTAHVHLSTPTITVPPGSVSQVKAQVEIRARYTPDPDTVILPATLHGWVDAIFLVDRHIGSGDQIVVQVKPTDDDGQIAFVPAEGSGATPAQATLISEQIRRSLRTQFEPMSVTLPSGVTFRQFKGLGTGAAAVLALPVDLSGGSAAEMSAIAGVNTVFLDDDDDYSVAVSRQYVQSLMQQMLTSIGDLEQTLTVKFLGLELADYHVSVGTPTVTWHHGEVKIKVDGSATTDSIFFPNYDFTVTQRLTLEFDVSAQRAILRPLGNPKVSGLPGQARSAARKAARDAVDDALQIVQPKIDLLLQRARLDGALASFNVGATSALTSVEITPDGVILRGEIGLPQRAPAVVHLAETGDGETLTAFRSWIPGGRITRYRWSWQSQGETPSDTILPPFTIKRVEEAHSFHFPIPEELSSQGTICLSIEGVQIGATSGVAPVLKTECLTFWPPIHAVLPAGWDGVTPIPIWGLKRLPNGALTRAVVGHRSAFARAPAGSVSGMRTVVHLTGASPAQPLAVIGQALAHRGHRETPVAVIVVAPVGSFKGRARLARRLGALNAPSVPLHVTEDYEAGWSRTFGVSEGPATFLLDPRGATVWEQKGKPDAALLAAALDEHAGEKRAPLRGMIVPSVLQGVFAPEVLLADAEGHSLALRRLRGRRVILNFWKSWSEPCLTELRHLQRLFERAEGNPAVVAVNDGEPAKRTAEVRRAHKLTLPLVSDPRREIAQRYAIVCWPTTIFIDEAGRVQSVRLGVRDDGLEPGEPAKRVRAPIRTRRPAQGTRAKGRSGRRSG